MTDQLSQLLLKSYQDGSSSAAFELHARYAERLFLLARSRIGDLLKAKVDPADIVQTSFQAFFEKADRNEVFWDEEGDLWRLLSAICINHVKREAEFYGAAKRDAAIETEATEQIVNQLGKASDHLSELVESIVQEQSPLALRIVRARLAGFKLTEIAAQTGRSERTIRRILQGLKAKLASMSEVNLAGHLLPHGTWEATALAASFKAKYEDFDLLRMVGAGAFGKVYLARNRVKESLVAVKALRRSWLGDSKAETLFLNEAKILASINHPNIIKFLDAGPLPNGSWFIVMEYVDGLGLDKAIQAVPNSKRVAAWLLQIGKAIVEIHKRGMTHGDLKPANIIVVQNNVRLIDFGFSRWQSEPAGAVIGGTAGFAAPEREATQAADVFAFGRVIEFVLRELEEGNSNDDFATLHEIAMDACSQNPDNRPTASQLLDRLTKV